MIMSKFIMAALKSCTAALVGFCVVALSPSSALAQATTNNAARVNSTIRPCFGMLLDAQLKTCGGRSYKSRSAHYRHGAGAASAVVDCDRARSGYVEEAARRVRAGGVLRLKAKNRSCVGTLDITKPITIIGDGTTAAIPALVAPDGQPCLRISPSARKVVIKDIYMASPRAQMAPCLDAANTELTLQNAHIRYEGDNAAVVLSGGRLNLIDETHIVAKTRSAAVAANDAVLFAEDVQIASTASGLYASLNGDSTLQGVTFQQLADWHGFERGEGATGVEIHLQNRGAIMTIDSIKVTHFSNGMVLDGAGEMLISNSLISGSNDAITSSLDRVRLIENTIMADEIGVNVVDGTAFLGRNNIAKVKTAGILASSHGEVRAVDNAIDPGDAGCPTLKWGNIDPAARTCTPWYQGSVFDAPADAKDQSMFADFWPRRAYVPSTAGTAPATATGTQDPVK